MLNVSRPHLTKLLKEGKMKFEEVGKHRRVLLASLMDYRAQEVTIREHFDECIVSGYHPLIDGLALPDMDDRHVLAAAINTMGGNRTFAAGLTVITLEAGSGHWFPKQT